ncbi:U24-ctenitoxin-Pn1a-like [Stegodyphus dumicola]|uniref:U24-ctenitoxin-Pn1a-like n=1 Tax=Stegodyphus dumicola TaxID=202533 RepID=UPI0015AA7972|nr:U24-ctenitoxin-Pn1a-like [Stegodyphus dumicola]
MLKTVGVLLLCLAAVAFADEREELTCQEDRAKRLNATVTESIIHLIPECDENGDYAAKQCFTNSKWCVCYTRDGTNIGRPSMKIKACECVRQRHEANLSGETYVPTCSDDGYYRPKQCNRDECWCVDKDGNSLTDPKTGDVTC